MDTVQREVIWWVDFGWLLGTHPAALSIPLPQQDRRRKKDGKARGLRQRPGDPLPITIMGKPVSA